MKMTTRLAYGVLSIAMLTGATAQPALAHEDAETGYAEADLGSLGLEAPLAVWCLVDAGSLGVDDPVQACR